MGNLHSSPWEGKLLLEGPYTFQNNYQVPWAFPAIICLCAMTILPLLKHKNPKHAQDKIHPHHQVIKTRGKNQKKRGQISMLACHCRRKK